MLVGSSRYCKTVLTFRYRWYARLCKFWSPRVSNGATDYTVNAHRVASPKLAHAEDFTKADV
jgi:hypothetical protein